MINDTTYVVLYYYVQFFNGKSLVTANCEDWRVILSHIYLPTTDVL